MRHMEASASVQVCVSVCLLCFFVRVCACALTLSAWYVYVFEYSSTVIVAKNPNVVRWLLDHIYLLPSGEPPDLLHCYFGLCGLAITRHEATTALNVAFGLSARALASVAAPK